MADFNPQQYMQELAILRADGSVHGTVPGTLSGIPAKDYILQASFDDWYFVGTLPHVVLAPEAQVGDVVLVFRKEMDPDRSGVQTRIIVDV
jgi:hypothetical protein